MIERCKPQNTYGKRGIIVCERWMIFGNFLADMGERPFGCEIDRENGADGYRPGNCRWLPKMMNRQRPETCVLTATTRAKILELDAAGWSQRKIAVEIGAAKNTVWKFLRSVSWRPHDAQIPLPPPIMVGPSEDNAA